MPSQPTLASTKFRPTIAGRPQVGTVIKIVFIRRGPHTVRGHPISSSPPSNFPIAPLPPRSLQLQCLYDCWCGRHGHKELPGEQLDVNCHHQPRDGAVLVSAWVCRNYTLPIHHTLELSTNLHEVFTVPGEGPYLLRAQYNSAQPGKT